MEIEKRDLLIKNILSEKREIKKDLTNKLNKLDKYILEMEYFFNLVFSILEEKREILTEILKIKYNNSKISKKDENIEKRKNNKINKNSKNSNNRIRNLIKDFNTISIDYVENFQEEYKKSLNNNSYNSHNSYNSVIGDFFGMFLFEETLTDASLQKLCENLLHFSLYIEVSTY